MKQGWVYKKFSEVFNLQMGKTPSRDNNSYWGGDNVWVSISDLKGKYIGSSKEHITDFGVSSSGITKVPKGTAIMSFKLTIGRAAITECDLYTNEAIMSFAPLQKDTLLADYIYYYLRGCKWTGANKAVMGQTLNKKTISENIFAYPSIDEQKAICSLLDKMNRVIEAKKEQLKELDNLTQAIFYDMFGDIDTILLKWETKTMVEVCKIIVDCPHTTPIKSEVPTEYPCIRTSELKGGFIHWGSMQYVSKNEYEKRISRLTPQSGDIVYGREGSFGDAVVLPQGWHFCLGQRTMLFRPDNDIVCTHFLHRVLISDVVLRQAQDKNVASTVAHVNVKDIKQFVIPIPPLPLQQAFAEKVKAIEQQKELINQSIKDVQTLFDAKMDYYFGD